MAIAQDNLLEDAKLDLVARLESDAFFSDVHVLYENEGDLDQARTNALAGRTSKSGKKGAAVVIHAVDIIAVEGQGPSPLLKLGAVIECAETRKLNHSSVGTGKTAAEIAARVCQLLHLYTPLHITKNSWYLPDNPVQELSLLDGMVGFAVEIHSGAQFGCVAKVATPSADLAGSDLTLTCATAGATILYTTDGTYPGTSNGTTYSAPISVSDGDQISFVATKADHNASDVNHAEISI